MYDNTQMKIITATMNLIMEKGYSSTTTKDIAKAAEINECTIFRKFNGKKDIVMAAMKLPDWNPLLEERDFRACGELVEDLISFSKVYMQKVTPQMVKVSMGLRAPELYEATAPEIMKIPQTFKKVLTEYFLNMQSKGIICDCNAEALAMQFLSMNFGFVFLDASFGNKLTLLDKDQYIKNSVEVFVHGIEGKSKN
ncbi:MAG: TetR/AcrR family transcriptional regulator [Lachnospiraceae bacterium]